MNTPTGTPRTDKALIPWDMLLERNLTTLSPYIDAGVSRRIEIENNALRQTLQDLCKNAKSLGHTGTVEWIENTLAKYPA